MLFSCLAVVPVFAGDQVLLWDKGENQNRFIISLPFSFTERREPGNKFTNPQSPQSPRSAVGRLWVRD